MYDSKQDTIMHRLIVNKYISSVMLSLSKKSMNHDNSKLYEPEKSIYDKVTPNLQKLTYGSNEYYEQLKEMKPALDHHYEHNSHHPEHYENGIKDMDLIDIVEMLADWMAATERHDNGDIMKSIEINQKRFNYSDELKQILINTVKRVMEPVQHYEIRSGSDVLSNSFNDYK